MYRPAAATLALTLLAACPGHVPDPSQLGEGCVVPMSDGTFACITDLLGTVDDDPLCEVLGGSTVTGPNEFLACEDAGYPEVCAGLIRPSEGEGTYRYAAASAEACEAQADQRIQP